MKISRTIAQGLFCSALLAGCNNGTPTTTAQAPAQPPPAPSSTNTPYASQPAPPAEAPAGTSSVAAPQPEPTATAPTPVPKASRNPAPPPASESPPAAEAPSAPPPEVEAPPTKPAPPPERLEPVVERPGYAWTPGYWRWDNGGHRYAWIRGSYVRARPGFVWVRAHWQRGDRGGWYFQPGYWQVTGAPPLGGPIPPRHGPIPPPHGPMPPPPPGSGMGNDDGFFRDALALGARDVEESSAAQTRSNNPDVKRFAQRLVGAEGASNRRLADASHLQPPPADNGSLQGLSSPELDRRYLSDMIASHQNAIGLYERASRSAGNPATRELASQILPNLRAQMATAQQLQNHLRPNPRTR